MFYGRFRYVVPVCTALLWAVLLNSCNKKQDALAIERDIFNSVLVTVLDSVHLSVMPPPINGTEENVYKNRQMLILVKDSVKILSVEDQIQFSKYYGNIEVSIDSADIMKSEEAHQVRLDFPKSNKYKFRYFSTNEYLTYPGFCGKLGLSKVKPDDSGTYAVFAVSFHGCQYYSNGNGCRVYVRKVKGRWRVDRIIPTWIT